VEFVEQQAKEIIAARASERGPLLEILHDLQDAFGYLDDRALAMAAEALNLTRADVHGVATFYHDFRSRPGGRTTIHLCRAEACQAMGADALVDHAERTLGVSVGKTRDDGAVTLEEAFCLGNCALSPSVMIDGRLYGRVDGARFDELAEQAVR
jgi:formate dehydrogenase subunit gamma